MPSKRFISQIDLRPSPICRLLSGFVDTCSNKPRSNEIWQNRRLMPPLLQRPFLRKVRQEIPQSSQSVIFSLEILNGALIPEFFFTVSCPKNSALSVRGFWSGYFALNDNAPYGLQLRAWIRPSTWGPSRIWHASRNMQERTTTQRKSTHIPKVRLWPTLLAKQ